VLAVPVVLTPMIMFSGILYERGSLPMYLSWLENLSIVNYGFSALLSMQVRDLVRLARVHSVVSPASGAHPRLACSTMDCVVCIDCHCGEERSRCRARGRGRVTCCGC
jgi:hypothetical protein